MEKSAVALPYVRRAPLLPGAVTTAEFRRSVAGAPDASPGPVSAAGIGLGGSKETDPASSAPPIQEAPTRGWAVVLYTSPGDPQKAMLALDRVKARASVEDAYLESRKDSHMVLVGDFEDPSSESAQATLRRLRSLEVDGARPFAQASLVPPPSVLVVGGSHESNLVLARRANGKDATYTLQVGVYERGDGRVPSDQDLAQIRKAAEEAVAALRKDGDAAYYYHGRTRSMVTIGLFGSRDYDERNPGAGDGPALAYARAKHPNNLVNGQGVRERIGADGKWRLQPSMMVAIPDE